MKQQHPGSEDPTAAQGAAARAAQDSGDEGTKGNDAQQLVDAANREVEAQIAQ